MTELHNTNNNNNHHTYSSSSFDWFDRNNNNNNNNQQQQQLPPIHFNTEMSSTTETGFHSNNNNMMDEDMVSRRSQQQQQQYGASSSTPGGWMNSNNNNTSTGYSPTRDSCDLSYDGNDDYHHHNHGQPTPSPSASTERSRSKKHRTPSTRDIHVEKNTEGKPPYSYATLIKYAIENSLRKKLTLSEIYQWVIDHYPYYGSAGTGWKNSIRHNLSLNKSFVRVPRPINEPGKGSYWQVDYRAAEAELRNKSNLAVRGRANRSGSDPYRPDSSWASLNNSSPFNNGGNQRFNRDSRSLSMDSNMNTKAAAAFSASSSSSSTSSAQAQAQAAAAVAAAAANIPNGPHYSNNNNGYYSHHHSGYGYNNNTRHNSLNNRHSADYSRSSYMGYDMYAPSVDGTLPHQQQHHYNHHNRMQQVPMYEHSNNHQPPYGQAMYSSGYPQQGYGNGGLLNDKDEEQHSFSTPQPHYRRVTSTSSPSLTTTSIKQEKSTSSNSPSPPQPSMDTTSKRGKTLNKPSCATVNGNDEYNWIA